MPSIIIAAHNEGTVLGRCLDALTANDGDAFEITVAANGCTDDTARVARRYAGIRVLDLESPGKAAALNAAEAVTTGFPRIYLDADITVSANGIRAMCAALDRGIHAAVPVRALQLANRPLIVRGYYAINARLPAFERGLFGRGAIAISAEGRSRFIEFPEMVADDLFLDSLFVDSEKVQVNPVVSRVEVPRRTRDLYHRLVRVRRGNAAMRSAAGDGQVPAEVRPRDNWAWLRIVVLRRPWLLPAAVAYVGVTVAATVAARREGVAWRQDRSSRDVVSEVRP